MDKLQTRVGLLFSSFSFVMFILGILFSIARGDILTFFTIENYSFVLYLIIFILTAFWKNIITRIIQIVLVFITAIIALLSTPYTPFFGLTILLSSMLLYWAYGFFNKYKPIKTVLFSIVLFCIFYFICLKDNDNRLLASIQWEAFISIFILLLWFIFKEGISKNIEYNSSLIKRYKDEMNLLENKLEIAVKTGIDLLDIIKSSNDHHRRKGDIDGE
jgi:hypothetical protein